MFKDEFYADIRNDFSNHVESSFLYQYIKKEKEKSMHEGKTGCAGQRKDYYIVVRIKHEEYRKGRISQGRYLRELLLVLADHAKLHLSEEARQQIFDGGKRLGGEALYEKVKKDRDKYRIFSNMIKANQDLEERNDLFGVEQIDRITEEVLDRILQIDAKAFLYDIGYSEGTRGREHHESRKKDRAMDMLSQYCEEKNILFNPQKLTEAKRLENPEYFRECESLYSQLNKDGIGKVFIPLEIDSGSGAGIFIIGKDYYRNKSKKMNRTGKSCYYSVLIFEEVIVEEDIENSVTFVMEEKRYTESLENAIKAMKAYTSSGGVWEGYQNNNEKKPHAYRGTFDIYFDSEMWGKEVESQKQRNEDMLAKEEMEDARNRYLQGRRGGR